MAQNRTSLLLSLLLVLAAPAQADDVSVTLPPGDGFVVKDNTGAIERLRVHEATGNVSRNGALFVHTTGGNTFVGENAGNPGTTGLANTAVGRDSLRFGTTGNFNSAFGQSAMNANSSGFLNSAFGANSLSNNSVGGSNSAFGYAALRDNQTSDNAAFGSASLRANTTGTRNAAFGSGSLGANTSVSDNAAFGFNSLGANTYGTRNAAFGSGALDANTTSSDNTAFGYDSLGANTGPRNSAFGSRALRSNVSGQLNTALGDGALENLSTGVANTALGAAAGINQTSGNFNLYLGNPGVDGESNAIKIGSEAHTSAAIGGVHFRTTGVSQGEARVVFVDGDGTLGTIPTGPKMEGVHGTLVSGIPVLVNANGNLGTSSSSARFKQDIEDMGAASEPVMKLRPVTFRYREDPQERQYGLIAEEVAEVAPELVAAGADGTPYTVKYHVLPALLLNELQKEKRVNREQEQVIEALSIRLEALEAERAGSAR